MRGSPAGWDARRWRQQKERQRILFVDVGDGARVADVTGERLLDPWPIDLSFIWVLTHKLRQQLHSQWGAEKVDEWVLVALQSVGRVMEMALSKLALQAPSNRRMPPVTIGQAVPPTASSSPSHPIASSVAPASSWSSPHGSSGSRLYTGRRCEDGTGRLSRAHPARLACACTEL